MPRDLDTLRGNCFEFSPTTSTAPRCLICGGELVPTRAAWRCTRCGQALCAGCEPPVANEGPGEAD